MQVWIVILYDYKEGFLQISSLVIHLEDYMNVHYKFIPMTYRPWLQEYSFYHAQFLFLQSIQNKAFAFSMSYIV